MKKSAGLLVYRIKSNKLEVLIAHMGGPWFAKKDVGAWSIFKGEYEDGEDPKKVAHREFKEETSQEPPKGQLTYLGTAQQKNKSVVAWAVEGDLDVSKLQSNTFKVEWPPRSGQIQEFPEIDRAGWFNPAEAAAKLIAGQAVFLERLTEKLELPFEKPDEPVQAQQSSLF